MASLPLKKYKSLFKKSLEPKNSSVFWAISAALDEEPKI
jgi:hypothetical protein